jgi:hypothetical protein
MSLCLRRRLRSCEHRGEGAEEFSSQLFHYGLLLILPRKGKHEGRPAVMLRCCPVQSWGGRVFCGGIRDKTGFVRDDAKRRTTHPTCNPN